MRIAALVATLLCLAGCFAFDNPYDLGGPSPIPPPLPKAEFQIVLTSVAYSGTYVWSSVDNAYSAVIGSTTYHVYMDTNGYWVLSYLYNWNHSSGGVYATTPTYGAQPVTSGVSWSPSGTVLNVDDSAGGICSMPVAPDSPVLVGNTLQVTFKASDPLNQATYQWEKSSSSAFLSTAPIGTASTYVVQSADLNFWIRVIVTPTDPTGVLIGSPVSSPPVYVN